VVVALTRYNCQHGREGVEAELKQHKIHTDAELARLSQQIADLKASYTKTREQVGSRLKDHESQKAIDVLCFCLLSFQLGQLHTQSFYFMK